MLCKKCQKKVDANGLYDLTVEAVTEYALPKLFAMWLHNAKEDFFGEIQREMHTLVAQQIAALEQKQERDEKQRYGQPCRHAWDCKGYERAGDGK